MCNWKLRGRKSELKMPIGVAPAAVQSRLMHSIKVCKRRREMKKKKREKEKNKQRSLHVVMFHVTMA